MSSGGFVFIIKMVLFSLLKNILDNEITNDFLSSLPDSRPPDNPEDDVDPQRSEAQRVRTAIEGVAYEPRHTKLENTLYRWLRGK